MANYKGLVVLDGTPTGDGGEAINSDFKLLVDWNPKSKWNATAYPTDDNDVSEDYQVGSKWFDPILGRFTCVDSTTDAAVWRGVPIGAIGLTVSATTNGTTQTELLLPGSNSIEVPENSTWAFSVTTVARRTDSGSDSKVWETKGVVRRATSSASILGTNVTTTWSDTGAIDWLLSVETSGSELQVLATPSGDFDPLDIEWTANVRIVPLTV